MKMNKSVRFGNMNSHYGPSSHKSNSKVLPDGRNAGQKNLMSIPQNYKPAAGSPKPTQASPSATGKLGDM